MGGLAECEEPGNFVWLSPFGGNYASGWILLRNVRGGGTSSKDHKKKTPKQLLGVGQWGEPGTYEKSLRAREILKGGLTFLISGDQPFQFAQDWRGSWDTGF